MADKHTTRPHGDRPGHGLGLPDHARAHATGGQLDRAADASDAEVELAMSDLIADERGEIVLFNDSGSRRLVVTTDAVAVTEGRSAAHRTATGVDVDGFRFVTFDNGVTLYYQPELDLVVRTAAT